MPLAPHAASLAAHGITPPLRDRNAPLKYTALAQLLISPEKGMPNELVHALYYIDELATPSGLDALEAAARPLGLWVDPHFDVPAAEGVLRLWLRDRALVERVHAEMAVRRMRSFEYFQAAGDEPPALPTPLATRLKRMEEELLDCFHQKRRGRYARVLVDERPDVLWLYVGHGGLLRREATVDESGASSICYRPQLYDAVIYLPATGELGIHARSLWERGLYQRVLGKHLFDDEQTFGGTAKYTLDPLLEYGQAALQCQDMPGLQWVRLVEITVLEPGHSPRFDSSRGEDLFSSWGTRRLRVSPAARLVSATFRYKLIDCAAPRRLTIRPSNRAQFTRDVDVEFMERWLVRRGFIRQRGSRGHASDDAVLAVA